MKAAEHSVVEFLTATKCPSTISSQPHRERALLLHTVNMRLPTMRNRPCFYLSVFCLVAVALPALAQAPPQDSVAQRIYLIGNSLTWDTVPSRLSGEVDWHVDCGKNLQYIYEHPEEPCVKSSKLWPTALKEKQYDIVCTQAHYGSTVNEDAEVIAHWLKLQPDAIFVIHTGWARSATLREEFANSDASGKLQHSTTYFDALLEKLRQQHPSREFRMTAATMLLNEIADDVEAGRAPLKSIEELYRDAIHMTTTSGRYLMHNVMRNAVGQPLSRDGFEKVPAEIRDYLDGKLKSQ